MENIYLSKSTINTENLAYYFDSQSRDNFDLGKINLRTSHFLSLKEKLLRLPDKDFNSVISTMDNLITSYSLKNAQPKENSSNKENMREVFERVSNYLNSTTDEVSRVQ